MAIVVPAFASVRPRVVVVSTGETRLLDEFIAEFVEEFPSVLIRITGGPGSGKSTALAHLAAVFANDDGFIYFDDPSDRELETLPNDRFILITAARGNARGVELVLEPWGQDELIEYLLLKNRDACGSVICRLGAAANWSWLPELACIVLDRFAGDASLTDPIKALEEHIHETLPDRAQRAAAARFSLALLATGSHDLEAAARKFSKAQCPPAVRRLLRHEMVQLPLAAERICESVSHGDDADLAAPLPVALIQMVGDRCRASQGSLINQLSKLLSSRRPRPYHAMAASILLVADPTWRPPRRRGPWHFANGVFRNAQWTELNLSGANLRNCDFTAAKLASAVL